VTGVRGAPGRIAAAEDQGVELEPVLELAHPEHGGAGGNERGASAEAYEVAALDGCSWL